jgi:hypothetical protein
MIELERTAASWRDEPVPPWHAPAMPRSAPSPWLVWLPLAATFLLAAFLLSQARIRYDENGFQMAFGSPEPIAAEPDTTLIANYLDQAIQHLRAENTRQMEAVFTRYRLEQEADFQDFMVALAAHTRDERSRDMDLLSERWRQQRNEDLRVLERHFNALYSTQRRQSNELYDIANFVNQQPPNQRPN